MATTQDTGAWYMVTVVGRDRPGIVAALSQALYQHGCNLGEASMIRLGGNFTIMIMAQCDVAAEALQQSLAPVAAQWDLRIHVDGIDAQLHAHVEPDVQISLYGADRAGIVADVTRELADAGLAILDLTSDVAGTVEQPVYIMLIEGLAQQGMEPLEQAIASLHQQGIEATLTALDTLVG